MLRASQIQRLKVKGVGTLNLLPHCGSGLPWLNNKQKPTPQ